MSGQDELNAPGLERINEMQHLATGVAEDTRDPAGCQGLGNHAGAGPLALCISFGWDQRSVPLLTPAHGWGLAVRSTMTLLSLV